MPLDHRDAAALWDMLTAGRTVAQFTRDVSLDEYHSNQMLRMAVERGFEILGEAARRISSGLRADHPEVPWAKIIAQRNVLSHDYGEIDDRRLFGVALEDVPHLIEQLEALLPPLPEDEDQ